jgi:hypothetical protein
VTPPDGPQRAVNNEWGHSDNSPVSARAAERFMKHTFSRIEDALDALSMGLPIIVVDS